jgi:hypothetical protein
VKADSGSDSDSESWNKNEEIIPVNRLTPTVCTDTPEPATIIRTNIRTEYFKHAAHSPFFPLQNAVYFIMLPFLVPILFTF